MIRPSAVPMPNDTTCLTRVPSRTSWCAYYIYSNEEHMGTQISASRQSCMGTSDHMLTRSRATLMIKLKHQRYCIAFYNVCDNALITLSFPRCVMVVIPSPSSAYSIHQKSPCLRDKSPKSSSTLRSPNLRYIFSL